MPLNARLVIPVCRVTLHDTDKSGVDLKLVWLERCHPRASAVADVLSAAGFPDFGKQLQQLAKEPSPR